MGHTHTHTHTHHLTLLHKYAVVHCIRATCFTDLYNGQIPNTISLFPVRGSTDLIGDNFKCSQNTENCYTVYARVCV